MTTTTTVTCDECGEPIGADDPRVTVALSRYVATAAGSKHVALDYHDAHRPVWIKDALADKPT